MKNWKNYQIIMMVLLCLFINLIGKTIGEILQLPLWLDSIGTVLAAYIFGPFCGAVVGVGVNLMYGAFYTSSYIYAATNLAVGVIAGVCARRGMFKKAFSVFSVSMILALSATIISLPLNYIYYGGMTGNLWGDGVINYMNEFGVRKEICWFLGEFYIDMLDKLISAFVVFTLINVYQKRKKIKNHNFMSLIVGIILIAMLPAKNLYAEDNTDDVKNSYYDGYIQTIYNNTNGIPGSEVNDIAQTMDGMIWVGTYGGLYQYDGKSFTFMSDFKSVRNVNCLYRDEEGRLWIGTNDCGLSISANNIIVNVVDKNSGLPEDSVKSITKSSDGVYYVGTTGALCVVDITDGVQVIKTIDALNYVNRLSSSEKGYVAATTLKGELAIIKNTEIVDFIKNSDGKEYSGVFFTEDGSLYVSTNGNTIEKYEILEDRLKCVSKYTCGSLMQINDVEQNADGVLFVCADNGIGFFDKNKEFKQINTNNFDSSIDHMLVDYQGNLWFSSSRLGLLKMSESISEEVYNRIGLEESVVNAICEWNNIIYVGTDSGLDVIDYEGHKALESEITTELNGVRIRCIVTDKSNHLWIATSGRGVYEVISDSKWNQYTTESGLVGDKTRSLLELSDGSMAVSTDLGISIISDDKVVANIDATDGLLTSRILCLLEKDGLLYAGTDGGGLAIIKDNKVINTLRKTDGLSSDVILRIVGASNNSDIIVVTGNGLNIYDEDGNLRLVENFPYYNNFDAIKMQDNSIWVTSSAGIFIIDEEDLLSGNVIDYETIDSKKGMRDSLTANSWNYLRDDNKLFLCGDKGVVLIDVSKYDKQKNSYRITLENILVDGVMVTVSKEENVIIHRDAVKVEFVPKVINFSASNPYVSVWLEGFDKEPKVVLQSELESMVYTNLPSGKYTFHLAILDNKQENVVEKISYNFIKEKEIYDNWWFVLYILLIMIIILVYLVWLIVGSQIDKSLKIQKKEFENLKLKQQADAAVAAGEAKDKFLALMSHDIRTPINAILGMNEMILRESSEKDINGYATDIKSAGNTLLSLVNMILDYSKIEEGKMEIIPVEYETKKLINILIGGVANRAKEKGLEFNINIDKDLPSVLYGDDVRINQVISNLLTNAVKYTEKGYMSLTIKQCDKKDDVVSIYVEVKDSGIGIKEEDKARLFESFKRLDEKRNRNIEGSGLGMSIVSSLLDLMDSELYVDSVYGEGSTFSFVIEQKVISDEPIGKYESSSYNAETKKIAVNVYAPNARLLVVDDNEMNIKVCEGLLKINGITPDCASSGEQAIELVKRNKYDLIFLDHMMPELDGIETLEIIKEQRLVDEATKIVILTANAINGAKEQYLKVGFDDYLSKPIEVEKLENILRKYLLQKLSKAPVEIVVDENLSPEKRLKAICPEITVETGLKYCMESMEFYDEILKEYQKSNKTAELNRFFEEKNWHDYQILVHSVKSNSLSIGALPVAEHAKALEYASRDGDIAYIEEQHMKFIEEYNVLLERLKKYFGK